MALLRLIPLPVRLLALVVVFSAIWLHGMSTGTGLVEARFAAEAQKVQERLDAAQTAAQEAERARLIAERERESQARLFEERVRALSGTDPVALPVDLVRELERQ